MRFEDILDQYPPDRIDGMMAGIGDRDVRLALNRSSLGPTDFMALLSPCAGDVLEEMARKAHGVTIRNFGRTILLYTPIYLSNYCVNHCLYCGFNAENAIGRSRLTVDEIEREAEAIAETGLKHILLLTGESRAMSSMAYLKSSVQCLSRFFSSVAIEIYPLDTDEYRELILDGVDAMTLYQETYNRSLYDALHVKGPKKNFAYRLDAPGRACDAGMRSVNIGALLGLDAYYRDVFLTGLHAWYLMKTYPDTEISVSFPRMRPHTGSYHPEHPVSDREFVQILTAMRLFLPRAGITISTREAESFRNNILPLGVTKMSAGSCTAVGGRTRDAEDAGQFEISDERSVNEMVRYLGQAGYQPVFKDWHPI